MSMIHTSTGLISRSGHGYQLSGWLILAVGGGGLLLAHLLRAIRTGEPQARQWMMRRGLALEPRGVEGTRQYLLRLRWSRVAAAVLLIAGCALAAAFFQGWISFVSLPFLVSVLLAETLAPLPRRGRLRSALLQRRSRSFFAPRWPLLIARSSIAGGAVLSLLGALNGSPKMATAALVHGLVLLAGGAALEGCLRAISGRPLPDREPDLSLDTAMRVASARTATAAALVFGTFGVLLGYAYARFGQGPVSTTGQVVGQLLGYAMLAAIGTAIALLQPLRAWHPRGAS